MTTHYYTNNTDLPSHEKELRYQFKDQDLYFLSDEGVFSKNRLDYGSCTLIDHFIYQPWMRSLLDVGCGYGAISLCLKKVYPFSWMTLVDVNQRAIGLAKRNVIRNQLDHVDVYESDVYQCIEEAYDVIISNPPIRAGKKVVFSILEGAFEHLHQQGELWIVIQKKQGAPSALKKMKEVFGNAEVVAKDKGYYIIKSKKE